MRDELAGVLWHVSTRSNSNGGNCVEAGRLVDGSGRVAVRDTKDRGGPTLVYSGADWASFLTGIRSGTFDR